MARHTSSRKAARSAKRARNHRTTKSAFGRPLYRRPLRLEPLEDRRLLAITVTTYEDIVDLSDGVTSLREAIFAANEVAGADVIDFAAELTQAGPAVIVLTQGALRITESLSIDGPGADALAIDAQLQSRVFHVAVTSGDFAFSGLTARRGRAAADNLPGPYWGGAIFSQTSGELRLDEMVVENSTSEGLFQGGQGGGVWATGWVSVHNSTIRNNSVLGSNSFGGGIYAAAGIEAVGVTFEGNRADRHGGGLFVPQTATTLQIVDSVFLRNEADRDGGAIYAQLNGVVAPEIVSSEIRGNTAERAGGVYFTQADLLIRGSVIANNTALQSGGGVLTGASSRLVLVDSEVSGNEANSGAGIAGTATVRGSSLFDNHASNNGGALSGQDLEIFDSTLSGNTAGNDGGAISANRPIQITRSTIANNTAGDLGGGIRAPGISLRDSIVAGNHAGSSAPDISQIDFGSEHVAHFSLIGDRSGSNFSEAPLGTPDANGNVIGGPIHGVIDPKLGPLTYNGGFELPGSPLLRTHAVLPGSPAIDAGDPSAVAGEAGVPEFDQRGEPHARVVDGRMDMGAYELQPAAKLQLIVDTVVDESDGDYSAGDLSLREAIELTNASNFEGIVDTISFDLASSGGESPAAFRIVLVQGSLVVTDSLEILGLHSQILTIDASGNDPTPEVDGGDGTQVFIVDDLSDESFVDVSMIGMTLTGGDAEFGGAILNSENLLLVNSIVSDNASATLGGGVFSLAGNLTLMHTDVIGNRAGADGGGVANFEGNLTVTDSTVSGNTARSGGGIYTVGGTATIEQSRIANNAASLSIGVGGGIQSTTSELVIRQSIVSGNAAHDGGGIYSGHSLELIDSAVRQNTATRNGAGIISLGGLSLDGTTVSGNQAGGSGGGIWAPAAVEMMNSTVARNSAGGNGGGVWLEVGHEPVTLVQVTVSGNRAAGQGGGLWIYDRDVAAGAPIEIRHSTIATNEAAGTGIGGGIFLVQGAVELDHTIVANNFAAVAQDLSGLIGATFTARYSLIGDNTGSGLVVPLAGTQDANGNWIGSVSSGFIDPLLAELAYNGGRTPTHALLSGSLALNTGDPAAVAGTGDVPTHDQREAPYVRIFGGRIDMGSFELSPSTFFAGDYSRNGVVDSVDYAIWRNRMGTHVAPMTGADGNGDGVVDDFDYLVWKLNFGMTPGGQGAAFGFAQDDRSIEPGVNSLFEAREIEAADEKVSSSDSIPFAFESIRSQSTVLNRAIGGERRDAQEDFGRLQREQGLAGWLRGRLMRGDETLAEPLSHEACTLERDADAVDAVMEGIGGVLPRLL